METEKQYRECEELRVIDDYIEEINKMTDISESLDGSESLDEVDKIIKLLLKALRQKEKYILKASKHWRKKQGFFSRMRDIRRENRELKTELAEEKLRLKSLQDELKVKTVKESTEETKNEASFVTEEEKTVQNENSSTAIINVNNEVMKF